MRLVIDDNTNLNVFNCEVFVIIDKKYWCFLIIEYVKAATDDDVNYARAFPESQDW